MKILIIAAMLVSGTAWGQSAYQRGYNAGAADHFPPSGTPRLNTDYGRGFNDAQDDAWADNEAIITPRRPITTLNSQNMDIFKGRAMLDSLTGQE